MCLIVEPDSRPLPNGSAHKLRRYQPTGETLYAFHEGCLAHKHNDLPLETRAASFMGWLGRNMLRGSQTGSL